MKVTRGALDTPELMLARFARWCNVEMSHARIAHYRLQEHLCEIAHYRHRVSGVARGRGRDCILCSLVSRRPAWGRSAGLFGTRRTFTWLARGAGIAGIRGVSSLEIVRRATTELTTAHCRFTQFTYSGVSTCLNAYPAVGNSSKPAAPI